MAKSREDYKVLLYCPREGGHHANFAMHVARGFCAIGVNLHWATTATIASSAGLGCARLIELTPRDHLSPAAWLRAQVDDLARLSRICRWDRLVLPSGDGLVQVLGAAESLGISVLPRGTVLEALVLRGGVAYPGSFVQKMKRSASWHLMCEAPMSTRHHLDPVLVDWAASRRPASARWRLMPDPVETSTLIEKGAARRMLNLPIDGVFVGCVGILDERKGIDCLVRGFEAASLPADAHLLLWGMCSREVSELVSALQEKPEYRERVHCSNRWVSDEELRIAICALDVVVAPYPEHVGSASIVLRAIAGQRPVLGSPTPWIARHIERYNAGWLANPMDSDTFAQAIGKSIQAASIWQPSLAAASLMRFNSPDNFMAHWTHDTCNALGISSPFTLIEMT